MKNAQNYLKLKFQDKLGRTLNFIKFYDMNDDTKEMYRLEGYYEFH